MPQQIYNLDWYASNESVKYPLDSMASCIPTGYDYVPQELLGVITDISFNIPYSVADTPYLAALSITDDLITLIICAGSTPLFAFSSTQSSLVVNRYYDLTSFATSCSGVIVFGESAKTHRCSYKFASAAEGGFLPSVYHRYMDYPVVSIGKKDGASAYQKDIFFKGDGDVKVEAVQVDNIGKITFSLDKPAETLQKYIGPCDVRPESGTCPRSSIERICSVVPDDNGNLVIKGDGIHISTFDGQLMLSTEYSLDDVCVKDKINDLIGEDTCCDTCQKKESEEDAEGCQGKSKSIYFDTDIDGFTGVGISINIDGVEPVEGEVTLLIGKLSDIRLLSMLVTRPEEGGYCKVSYGTTLIDIGPTSVSWNGTHSLYDNDTSKYPTQVGVLIDHCRGNNVLSGFGNIWTSNSNLEEFSASITFKGCCIRSIKYVKEE